MMPWNWPIVRGGIVVGKLGMASGHRERIVRDGGS